MNAADVWASPHVKWAVSLLQESSAAALVGHCQRSTGFAMLIAAHEREVNEIDVDVEALVVGTLLHDIGLAPHLDGPDRFEARGANAARAHLRERGWSSARAENVWDIIALHATSTLAAHKSIETSIANQGISIDIRGVGHQLLSSAAVRDVLDRWPRHEFPEAFTALLVDEVRAHPDTTRFCWMEGIAADHVDGYLRPSFVGTLRASAPFV